MERDAVGLDFTDTVPFWVRRRWNPTVKTPPYGSTMGARIHAELGSVWTCGALLLDGVELLAIDWLVPDVVPHLPRERWHDRYPLSWPTLNPPKADAVAKFAKRIGPAVTFYAAQSGWLRWLVAPLNLTDTERNPPLPKRSGRRLKPRRRRRSLAV